MKIKSIIFFAFAIIGLSAMSVTKGNAQPTLCEPVTNVVVDIDPRCTATISWNMPWPIDGVLLGYNIYRNGILIAMSPEIVYIDEYLDYGYGEHCWVVTAVYEHCESFGNQACGHCVPYTIFATAGPNGNINPSGEVNVAVGGSQTFTFTPNEHYKINEVRVDEVWIGNPSEYTFMNVHESHSIHVNFILDITATTLDATNITFSSATLNGTTYFGSATVNKQGFILTTPVGNDTIAVSNTITNLTYNVTDLPRITTFSYKTYCTTVYGTVFGEEKQFTTLPFKLENMTNLIEDIDDMLLLAKLVEEGNSFEGQKFKLVNHITLPNTPNNIKAIGKYDDNYANRRPFCGEFDGNNKIIYNVYIDHPNTPYQGLFGYAKNADIHNLGIENITASGRNYTGGMIAYSENSKITDCYVSGGTLYALSYCGGLIGYQTPGTNSIITSCYNNNCSVSGNKYVGGLLGYSDKGTVRNSWVSTLVTGLSGTAGAIIGGAFDVLFYNWWYNNSITDLPAIGENLISGKSDGDGGISSEEMRKPEFVNTLNQGLPIPAWKMDYNPPINNGFPILVWQSNQTTGIVSLEKESNINLYPNPVQNNFTLNFESETKGQVIIYDLLGKIVISQEFSGTNPTISIANLSKGIYHLRVVTNGKTMGVSKIVKQ